MQSVFVTGTDTDVGKTVIGACIARAAKKSGVNIGVMKPFAASDSPASEKYNSHDTEILARLAKCTESDSELNPVFSQMPASPYTASCREDLEFDIKDVLDSYRKLCKSHDAMLVEGIGGIMTPIREDYFVSDLVKEMNLPTVIVSRNRIGALNHAILAHMACKNALIPVAGFVINCIDDDGYDPQHLAEDIGAITGIRILGIVPKMDLTAGNLAFDAIADVLNLDALGINL